MGASPAVPALPLPLSIPLARVRDAAVLFFAGAALFAPPLLVSAGAGVDPPLAQSLASVLGACAVSLLTLREAARVRLHACWGLLLAGLAIAASGAFHAQAPRLVWLSAGQALALAFAAFALSGWLGPDAGRRRALWRLLGAFAVLQVALSGLQHLGFPFRALGGPFGALDAAAMAVTPFGSFGNVNFMAEALSALLPALVWLGRDAKAGRLWRVAALGAACALVATGTRAVLLTLPLAVLGAAVLVWPDAPRRAWRALRARPRRALFAAALLAGALAAFGGRFFWKLGFAPAADPAVHARLGLWRAAWGMAREHRAAGVGWGHFHLALEPYVRRAFPEGLPERFATGYSHEAHSEPLQALAELGPFGLLAFAGALLAWIRLARRNPLLGPAERWAALAGVLALVAASFFAFPFQIPTTAWLACLLLALGAAAPPPVAAPGPARRAAAAAPVLALALFVPLALVPSWLAQAAGTRGDLALSAGRVAEAAAELAQAEKAAFYRDAIRYERLEALYRAKRYAEVVALAPTNAALGTHRNAALIVAAAHERLGHREAAFALYRELDRLYAPGVGVRAQTLLGMFRNRPPR